MTALHGSAPAAAGRLVRRLPGVGSDAQTLLAGVLRLFDALIVPAAALLAYWVRQGSVSMPSLYITATLLGTLLALNFMQILGVYRADALRRPGLQLGKASAAWLLAVAVLLSIAYLTSTSIVYSRAWALLWLAFAVIGFVVLRAIAAVRVVHWRRAGLLSVRVAIIGTGELARLVARQLRDVPDHDYRIAGFYAFECAPGAVPLLPSAGGLDELLAAVTANQVDEVLVALPWTAAADFDRLLKRLNAIPVNVRICPDIALLNRAVRRLAPIPGLPTFDLYERPISGWAQVLKRLEDLILTPLMLLLALPILAVITAAIKLDSPGPVLFRQRRYGFNNNEFTVYKFRTMRHDSDDKEVAQARRVDDRVTRVGALLRRTSLDELPQLLNVLKGDMSLVGPRPHAIAHNKHFAAIVDDYLGRHRVKPGITGWAQVNGLRGETRTEEQMRLRVQHDLYYIDHWSLWMDLKILVLTLFVGFVHENAY